MSRRQDRKNDPEVTSHAGFRCRFFGSMSEKLKHVCGLSLSGFFVLMDNIPYSDTI
jgi:hypothetical protein